MGTTINLVVAASADDADETTTGVVVINGTVPSLAPAGRLFGARWQATVPAGATIDSATFSVYLPNADYDDPVTDVVGLDADSADAFTAGSNHNISSRDTTTATVAWDGTGLGTGYKAITVTNIVQEIVNRPGWASGNYIGLVIVSDTGCSLRLYAYDAGPGTAPPKLDITYTEATSAGSKTSRVRLSSLVGGRLT